MTTQSYRRARHSVSLQPPPGARDQIPPAAFTDAMLTITEHTMRGVCVELGADLVEFNGEADHVRSTTD